MRGRPACSSQPPYEESLQTPVREEIAPVDTSERRQTQYLHAIVTVAAQQNLCDLSEASACSLAPVGQFDLLHARDGAAIDTHKVRVRRMPQPLSSDELKSPSVITEFRSTQQIGYGHVV